ncbi:toxin [Mycobacterium tuberculosis RGTB327]|nr:toxin [Mycobacterium tuberculosis RGTB327]
MVVNRALLASVDALSRDEQIELVEHINGNLAEGMHISEANQALIEARAKHTSEGRPWTTIDDFDKRIRARLG